MHRHIGIVLSSFLLFACSSQKVVELDGSGHYPGKKAATVVLSKPFDLDARKELILVPPNDFAKGQVVNMHYFGEVITPEDLQRAIVKSGLSDKIPSTNDLIGVSNAAKNYRPFIWFRIKSRGAGMDEYSQFILTDPITLDDIFVAETHLDFLWTGVNDQYNWYPMFNAMIDYIKANSKQYGK